MKEDMLTSKVIGEAIEVHKALGPGLFEHVYEACLAYRLRKAGLDVKTQLYIDIVYEELLIERAYKLDLLVNDELIVDTKADEKVINKHKAQVITYLRLKNLERGLILNFNNLRLKDGIFRVFAHGPVIGPDGLS